MATDRVERRMAAIVAADMVGYSRLMEADETGTLAALKAHRSELLDPTIAEYNGRIVKTTGDGMLVEFASVVDAVASSVAIQREMVSRNEAVPEDRRIEFRVGINLGDIIIDGDDIYGDGVNIAARLEQLAEPGGVCISGTAYEHLKATVDVGYADLGDQRVKNIETPVRAYRVLLDPGAAGTIISAPQPRFRNLRVRAIAALALIVIVAGGLALWQPWIERVEAASVERMAFPLPVKPSIAVLPFANLTGDPERNIVSDGITENITTALSRSPDLFVIARTSTLAYKGKSVKVQQVAEELGVRYILEGSVQQSGNQIRITAQLIDAVKGHHLWADSYDREVKNAFALQDQIALNVLSELEVKLTQGAISRLTRSGTNSLEAYQLLRQGFPHFWRQTEEENAEARRLFEKAVDADPEFAHAWYMVGNTYEQSARFGWGEDPTQSGVRAKELAEKAIAIDPSSPGAYNLLSQISLRNRQYDEGLAFLEKAVALSPNSHIYLAILGRTLGLVGRPEEGLPLIQQGIRRNPFTQPFLLRWEGEAYYLLGQYEDAIAAFERTRTRDPKAHDPLVRLALTYADMGRMEEARTMAQEVLKLNPKFSAQEWASGQFHKDPAIPEHFFSTLRQLGLPN